MINTYIDKLALIVVKDKKTLVTKSKGKDVWYTPGGKREQGETDKEALTREIKEELCVELLPETIQYYGAFEAQAHGKPEGTKVRNTCYTAKFRGEMRPGGEIEKIAWISFSDKEQCSLTQQLIMDDLKKNNLIE